MSGVAQFLRDYNPGFVGTESTSSGTPKLNRRLFRKVVVLHKDAAIS